MISKAYGFNFSNFSNFFNFFSNPLPWVLLSSGTLDLL